MFDLILSSLGHHPRGRLLQFAGHAATGRPLQWAGLPAGGVTLNGWTLPWRMTGDKIKFDAEHINGQFVVTKIKKTKCRRVAQISKRKSSSPLVLKLAKAFFVRGDDSPKIRHAAHLLSY